MFKIILIAVVFSIFSLLGYSYGQRFKKRLDFLRESYKGIMFLQNEVIFNHTPLPEAIDIISNKLIEPFRVLLARVSENLLSGNNFDVYSAFRDAYFNKEDELYLKKEDIKIIEDLTKALGESGAYGQEKIFKFSLENLKLNIEEAAQLSKSNSKLYRNLGVCIGAMISILLL